MLTSESCIERDNLLSPHIRPNTSQKNNSFKQNLKRHNNTFDGQDKIYDI